ncbi:MAG TPA: tRNA pseudouridine(38-40) synthase TruA [Blastocatellia bacterium]|nr:tRNA pseudouridine(38-40) synthase TruA [Blastocatellia bacterium]
MPQDLRNIKITIQYDGTDYHGWQIQNGLRTIQGELTRVLSLIDGREVIVHGSGRTDAGVHALGQVASFQFAHPHSTDKLLMAINGNLLPDIRVIRAEEVTDDFHARFSAKSKLYRYQIFTGRVLSPFLFRYVHQTSYLLNLNAMHEAAKQLLGEHDFRSFTVTPEKDMDTTRCLTSLHIGFDHKQELLAFELSANGFLRYMVRTIVGTLVDIGRGHLPPNSIPEIFAASSRVAAGTALPAKGLTLVKVDY